MRLPLRRRKCKIGPPNFREIMTEPSQFCLASPAGGHVLSLQTVWPLSACWFSLTYLISKSVSCPLYLTLRAVGHAVRSPAAPQCWADPGPSPAVCDASGSLHVAAFREDVAQSGACSCLPNAVRPRGGGSQASPGVAHLSVFLLGGCGDLEKRHTGPATGRLR